MNEYSFDHEQISAHKELSEIAKEVHNAALSKDHTE